jgi:hypothetical protein
MTASQALPPAQKTRAEKMRLVLKPKMNGMPNGERRPKPMRYSFFLFYAFKKT